MPEPAKLQDLTLQERFRLFYPGGIEEAEDAYPPDDPKRDDWHSVHADLYDSREGK